MAAGAVVSPGALVPKGGVLMGARALVKRFVADKDYVFAKRYIALAADYRAVPGA